MACTTGIQGREPILGIGSGKGIGGEYVRSYGGDRWRGSSRRHYM